MSELHNVRNNLDVDLADDGGEADDRIFIIALQVLQKYIRNPAFLLIWRKILAILEKTDQGSCLNGLVRIVDHLEDPLAEVDAKEICWQTLIQSWQC